MIFYIIFALMLGVAGYFYLQLGNASRPQEVVTRVAAPKTASNNNNNNNNNSSGAADNKRVCILFGSQTGTAEMFAKTLAREGEKLGVPTVLCDVETYETYNLEYERMVILVCATYGEGEPTDSMKAFHDWMMDADTRSPGEELANVRYAVFGLGDKQYKYFCEEGIVMDRRFDELGAQRVYGLGCGDSGNGAVEEQFDEWRAGLWPAVGAALGIALKANTEEPVEPECKMRYWDAAEEAPLAFPKTASVLEPTQKLPVWVPVVKNEELLRGDASGERRSTRCIEFNIADTIISYQAGDHLGILPRNPDALVDDYLRVLGVSEAEAARVFSLQDKKTLKNVFPARVTARTALTWYVDLAGPPKKSTLRAFAHCCTDEAQKEELLRLLRVGPESQREFSKLCGQLRTMYGFLRKFDSAKVPLSFFLELMPRTSPRYYSVSSDLLDTPDIVGATVAVVEGGLCTQMLAGLRVGDRVPVFVRKSTFHLPLREKERAVIMIGPGTGVAPFIGFIRRRFAWKAKNSALGKAILFFGCRRRDEDYIYEDLCARALHEGVLSGLDVAFSREQSEKVYVQHRVRARAAELWELIDKENALLFICGDAKHMARDVEAELVRMVETHGNMGADAAKAYIAELENSGRFLKDVWSSSL